MKIDDGMPQRSDEQLLAEMAHGTVDEARGALRTFYERHAPAVLSFLLRLSDDVDLAEDILQDCFLAASRKAGRFRQGSARAWLCSIAASRLGAARRAARRRKRREFRAARREAAPWTADVGADAELERALASLPASERAVLELRFHAGLDFRAVAEVLGVSLRTAKSWSAAGLERLRGAMGEPEGPR